MSSTNDLSRDPDFLKHIGVSREYNRDSVQLRFDGAAVMVKGM